jgi:hypothetical protein
LCAVSSLWVAQVLGTLITIIAGRITVRTDVEVYIAYIYGTGFPVITVSGIQTRCHTVRVIGIDQVLTSGSIGTGLAGIQGTEVIIIQRIGGIADLDCTLVIIITKNGCVYHLIGTLERDRITDIECAWIGIVAEISRLT